MPLNLYYKFFSQGEEYRYKQEWGEQLVGKHLSVIVVCKLPTETFTVLQGLSESWCPGQVCLTVQVKVLCPSNPGTFISEKS